MHPPLPLYFDNHATTPLDPHVLEAMLPFFKEDFGNAESSQHAYGWKAKTAVDRARLQLASLIAAQPQEIVFTSGATESLHLAILGSVDGDTGSRDSRHIITANSEHKATLEVCARAAKHGHEVTVLPVDHLGRITVDQVEAALTPKTALVTLMHGNNEIGTIHPIAEIGAMLERHSEKRPRKITFHVDAAQTIGKHHIDVQQMKIDLLSISGHKFYAPKGVGALFVRRKPSNTHLTPYIIGGGQERGLRGGTHNVPGIVGLGMASELAMGELEKENSRLTTLRNHLVQSVQSQLQDVALNGDPTLRLCNNVSFTVRGAPSDLLLLGMKEVAYSSASACSAGAESHVLKAIGQRSGDPMVTTMRFGLGRFTTTEQVESLVKILVTTVSKARAVSMV